MSDIIVRVIDAYVFTRKNNQIRFLILKRAKTKMYEHLWQGVAGKIEEGETSWEAASASRATTTALLASSTLRVVARTPVRASSAHSHKQ